MPYIELLERAEIGASPINTLVNRGRVEVFLEETLRDRIGNSDLPDIGTIELTGEQRTALKRSTQRSRSTRTSRFFFTALPAAERPRFISRQCRWRSTRVGRR